ncbi:hypothetical protein [Caballeronia grimmiae]|uniref:hypothetical protein n=1 Tax=Caballeronia grimmiae TaxID=1071679 RepID=UPI0038B6D507
MIAFDTFITMVALQAANVLLPGPLTTSVPYAAGLSGCLMLGSLLAVELLETGADAADGVDAGDGCCPESAVGLPLEELEPPPHPAIKNAAITTAASRSLILLLRSCNPNTSIKHF